MSRRKLFFAAAAFGIVAGAVGANSLAKSGEPPAFTDVPAPEWNDNVTVKVVDAIRAEVSLRQTYYGGTYTLDRSWSEVQLRPNFTLYARAENGKVYLNDTNRVVCRFNGSGEREWCRVHNPAYDKYMVEHHRKLRNYDEDRGCYLTW